MKVFVIRHGQCEANVQKAFSGWMDSPLTEKGRKDAEMAGRLLKGVAFDRIFSSDLSRAHDTQRIALPGCEAELRMELREINNGSVAGLPIAYANEKYGERAGKARTSRDFTIYGGENRTQQLERIGCFMRELETLSCGKVAVFCHEGTVQSILSYVFGCPVDPWSNWCANGSVSVFEFTGGKWKLDSWNIRENMFE